MGNQFLGHIREVDALAHVVRLFTNEDVAHSTGTVDPRRDVEIVDLELMLADLETIRKRRERTERMLKTERPSTKKSWSCWKSTRPLWSRAFPCAALPPSSARSAAPFSQTGGVCAQHR